MQKIFKIHLRLCTEPIENLRLMTQLKLVTKIGFFLILTLFNEKVFAQIAETNSFNESLVLSKEVQNNDGNYVQLLQLNIPYAVDKASISINAIQDLAGNWKTTDLEDISFTSFIQTVDKKMVTNLTIECPKKIKAVKVSYKQQKNQKKDGFSYAANLQDNSILNDGDWYKIRVTNEGFYQLSYAFLSELGLNVNGVSSKNIIVAGNSFGIMPTANDVYRPNDLALNATIIEDGGDGVFNPGDFVAFYSSGAHNIYYNNGTQAYERQKNPNDNYNYYFIGVSNSLSSPEINSVQAPPIDGVEETDFFWNILTHEDDKTNVIKSGKVLYGEKFENKLSYSFPFTFSNAVSDQPLKVVVDVLSRSITTPSYFDITINGQSQDPITASALSDRDYRYGFPVKRVFQLNNGFTSSVNVDIDYAALGTQSIGYLNFIALNVPTENSLSVGNSILRFTPGTQQNILLKQGSSSVYNVTNPTNILKVEGASVGSNYAFASDASAENIYATYNGSNLLSPGVVGKVANQNLHALSGVEYLIIAHPNFVSEANRLAELHRKDGLSVEVVQPSLIYNEFSSGAQDPTGIKDFCKHLYFKNIRDGQPDLKYLLLFGDGSYNNRSYEGNTNFLPTYQSDNSTSQTASYVTDDYFGLLDDNESERPADLVDIGIGRFPVKTIEEARAVVNKVYNYSGANLNEENQDEIFGPWRNKILFTSDDQDGSSDDGHVHMKQANDLSKKVESFKNGYIVEKIFADAFRQESTPGGERYPEVNERIKQSVESGALVVNYTGHGGEVGWAHERILDLTTIQGWTNFNKLPLFVTATCEFSRFDDPERTSAGEMVLLNPKGGGIALLSTTRLVYSSPNFLINNNFYSSLFPNGDEVLRLGDVTKRTKNKCSIQNASSINHLNFALLGDPALRLAYPRNKVHTTHLNGVPVESGLDTLTALGLVRLEGKVVDNSGNLMADFNGVLDVSIYDKPEDISTLVNDNGSPFNYQDRLNIIFKGRASVKNGVFDFQFVVPKDIAPSVGAGYINYYAHSGTDDANGQNDTISVGGISSNAVIDDAGPEVDLTLNKEGFVSGDFVGENPEMIAVVFDESGINTTGNGIGHDLVAILDEQTSNPVVLNQYFKYDLDSYQRGVIQYPFSSLSEGEHTLSIKVWDINNNSASTAIDFIVIKSGEIKVENLINFPNPATNNTTFAFEHNVTGLDVQAQLIITDITGKKVKEITEFINESNYRSKSLSWDLQSDGGVAINNGIYVYKLVLTLPNGNQIDKSGRLVVAR